MADIVFRYNDMRTAAQTIRNIGNKYKTEANTFIENFGDSISSWEGESKEKTWQFVNGPIREYIEETIPQLVEALASLLEANASQMEAADKQIAENIPTSLG